MPGSPSRVFFCFVFLFYFSDICSDLVIILNQFIYLCHFFMEASYIIPELLYKWHNFWTIFYIYNNIYPKQIITALIPNAQNKYL